MQTRRTFVRGAGLVGLAALAGCTAIADGGSTPPDDPGTSGPGTEPTELEVPPDATHRVTVASVDDAPDLPVRPRVSLADPFLTSGSPPALRIDVENPTDEAVTVGEYRAVVFQYVHSADRGYLLLPLSERSTEGDPDRVRGDYEVTDEGCFQLTEPIAVTMEYGTVEIPAGGTLTAYVGLYVAPDADDCPPVGEHRFEANYSVAPLADDGDDERWGFSLSVEAL
jgi:hypothetical protein